MVKIDIPISKESKKFVALFYESSFSPFDFVCSLVAILKLHNVESFQYNSVESFILRCKRVGLYDQILKDISFRSNGIDDYSGVFRDAISKAKNSGLLYSISPEKDSTLFIDHIDPSLLLEGKEEYSCLMESFLCDSGILRLDEKEIENREIQHLINTERNNVTRVLTKVINVRSNNSSIE